jgi:aryl-alcohol dehydrogenase-like predicted oxidoreductase
MATEATNMRYKLVGRSGLRVSELCLGTMTFGEDWGWGANKDESRRMFDAFAEAGGNFLDTADGYTNGTSERMLGEFIASDRGHWVLATKYSFNQKKGDPNAGGNHRKNMVQALEGSLQRLRTDYVDLYWVHAWDEMTPVDELMRGLNDVVQAGKALYVGISDAPAWIVSQANMLADCRGWAPFVALQIEYSLVERTPERDLLPMARALDLAVTPWSPLGGGVLSGKYGQGTPKPDAGRLNTFQIGDRLNERTLKIAGTVTRVAHDGGHSPSQVALAWLRAQPGVQIPIVGARNLEQLKDNLRCLSVRLSEEQLHRLDEASRVPLGFPHDFLTDPAIRDRLHGGTYDQIDVHRPTGRSCTVGRGSVAVKAK